MDAASLSGALDVFISRAAMPHCRPHMYVVMEGLKEKFPKLWEEKRLGMISVGDVFLELDKKMKAGKVPGIVNIGEYSADGGHLRGGLPRYTLAATYYAVLFQDHPKNVDWKIFQEEGNYESGKYGFYVHQPDLAVHLDITPERAKIVNDTIWEVIKKQPIRFCQKTEHPLILAWRGRFALKKPKTPTFWVYRRSESGLLVFSIYPSRAVVMRPPLGVFPVGAANGTFLLKISLICCKLPAFWLDLCQSWLRSMY